jgi:signal transduction histidine kinase
MDLSAFHEELRRKNLPILLWSACVFNAAYLAWTGFDYVLAPDLWRRFFLFRLSASGINTVIAILVVRGPLRRYTWEGFWAWLFVFGAFIAPMLAEVHYNFAPYVMGFTLILFGAGLLPFWPPRWAISNVMAVVSTVPIALLLGGEMPSEGLVSGIAFIGTGSGLAIVMAWYKYDFSRRDFFQREELEAAVRRESEAHARLERATAELEGALERLKELDRVKNGFFANVSHELRTPLTLILAPVEDLLTRADESVRAPLRVVRRNAERLLRLIDDLLDLTRLDAGGLRLNIAEVDLRALVQTVHENSVPAAVAQGIELTYETEPSQRRVYGDAHRLEIVLTNLIGNALKYTPRGGTVALRVRDRAGAVELAVADTGPGIPAADLTRVFERFYQVGTGDRRQLGGVGIGLALAKELTELHGGQLEVDSRVGEGSTFRLRLPFGRDHIRPDAIERRRSLAAPGRYGRRLDDPPGGTDSGPVPQSGPTAIPQSGPTAIPPSGPTAIPAEISVPWRLAGGRRARLVVAEDNDELRRFVNDLLSVEHDVLLARDGDEAWELVRRERPDLVVSDIMMPKRTGAALCKEIKRDPELGATPVILLTARVGSEATLEGYAHGADDFVAKPFHPGVLQARVRAQLRLRAMALQLAEQEKAAAIGALAAGVLHEVRNPVNAIVNAARVLAGGRADAAKSKRLLAVIADGAERIQAITGALDAHVRPADGGQTSTSDAREGIDATLRLLEHRMDAVAVERSYSSQRPTAAAAGPLNQVFLNLLDNALKAGAQRLRVEVADAGDRVRIAIEDDGRGVPVDLAPRMFDPFVSGGEQPGSGLGLYLSRRIVEQFGGRLWYEPRREGGSRFAVELPAADGALPT